MSTSPTVRSRGSKTSIPYPRRRRSSVGQRIFRTILLILVVVLVSVAGTLYFVWPEISSNLGFAQAGQETVETAAHTDEPAARPAAAPSPNNEKPIFVAFEPFTVTLTKDGRSRILYVGITLQVTNKESELLLLEYQPVVRDRILAILSAQDPNEVQSTDGRRALTRALEESLMAPYRPSNQVPQIDQVLFTAFVVQ